MDNFLTGTSNADYHADRTHLSSSGLKMLLQDPAQFYKEYVLGERVQKETAAFTEGTLVHMLILEPHLVSETYAVYPGYRRSGKEYENWVEENAQGKIVVTKAQMDRAKELAAACLANPDALCLLEAGQPELSLVGNYKNVPVKCRADYISVSRKYIVDVKTSSKPTGPELFAETIAQFCYDLSAVLYCEIASENFHVLFDFYWIVISKADKGVSVVKATSEDIRLGLSKLHQAIEIYKHCKRTGIWKLPEPSELKTVTPTKKENKMSNSFKTKKGTELPLMSLKGKPYLQVAHRFVMLNEDTTRFVIETTFPVLTGEETVCHARVMICSEVGEVLRQANGTKRETKKDFPDHTEKAETGAIGRALAMLGYGTQFAIQDMDEGERLADAPVVPAKRPVKAVSKASGDEF